MIRKEFLVVAATLLVLFCLRMIYIAKFGDTGWEPDEYLHFLQTKTVFANFPSNLFIGLEVWAKPVFTYPYGLVLSIFSAQSLFTLRVISTVIGLVSMVYVYKSIRLITGKIELSWLGMVLLGLSFLVFRATTAVMTEPIFMLLVSMAFYYWLRKKWLVSSLLIGLMVVARLEGAIFIPVWIYFLWREKLPLKQLIQNAALLIIPVGIWNLLGFLTTGRLLFLVSNGYPTESGVFGYGGLSHYSRGFISQELLLTLGFVLAFVFFAKKLLKKTANKDVKLVFTSFIAFFLVQNVLWIGGWFGTAGLMRYFVGVIPFLVIIFVWGLWELLKWLKPSSRIKSLAIFGIILIQLVLLVVQLNPGAYYLGLYSYPRIEPELVLAGKWVSENVEDSIPVYADRPSTIYYSRRDLINSSARLNPHFQERKQGVYVWSRTWGSLQGVNLEDFQALNAKLLHSINDFVYIYEI